LTKNKLDYIDQFFEEDNPENWRILVDNYNNYIYIDEEQPLGDAYNVGDFELMNIPKLIFIRNIYQQIIFCYSHFHFYTRYTRCNLHV
jgi:hypothetical protein